MKDGIDPPDFEAKLQELSQLTQAAGYGNEQLPGPRDRGMAGSVISLDEDVFYTPYGCMEEEKKPSEIVIVQDFKTSGVVSRQRQLELFETARNF